MVDRQRQRSIDRYRDNVQAIQTFLDALTPRKLDELLRINQETNDPDGFPAGGHGEGSKSSTEDTATERAALRGLPDEDSADSAYWTTNAEGQRIRSDLWHRHNRPDPVGHQIEELLAHLVEMAGLSKRAVRVMASIDHRPGLVKEREQVMDRCNACQRWCSGGEPPEAFEDDIDDPLDIVAGYRRSGYCDSCRRAWDRAGKPDRPKFEAERLARHQQAKERREATHTDPVLEYVGVAQSRGILPTGRVPATTRES